MRNLQPARILPTSRVSVSPANRDLSRVGGTFNGAFRCSLSPLPGRSKSVGGSCGLLPQFIFASHTHVLCRGRHLPVQKIHLKPDERPNRLAVPNLHKV